MEHDLSHYIGLDIGGTKIAGAVFDQNGTEIAQRILSTPVDYADFLTACSEIVAYLDEKSGSQSPVGIGIPGVIDRENGSVVAGNIPCLAGKSFLKDIEERLARPVLLNNDANCAALSEAIDGAGQGYRSVFGITLGTGVGGGLVIDQKINVGTNGLGGEWGHVALPFREDADGPVSICPFCKMNCIETLASGPALSRLYKTLSGEEIGATRVGEMAQSGDVQARQAIDRYFTIVAKALMTIVNIIDPEAIVISGGLSNLPGLYVEVRTRMNRYAAHNPLKTKVLPAKHGAMSGLRGAAWLGRKS